ncbi:MAG: PP2C family protein-serine/threonine phosphatase, partial [Burkholderiales bacterium]
MKSPTVVQASRVGAREINEDRVGRWATGGAVLLAVADGLGGHQHGEVAAQIAIDILGAAFQGEA